MDMMELEKMQTGSTFWDQISSVLRKYMQLRLFSILLVLSSQKHCEKLCLLQGTNNKVNKVELLRFLMR